MEVFFDYGFAVFVNCVALYVAICGKLSFFLETTNSINYTQLGAYN